MKRAAFTVGCFLFVCFASSGCATTKVERLGAVYTPKPSNCEIAFYKRTGPEREFEVIGKIESHIKRDFFLGGVAGLEDEGYKELRKKACGLGGDAVVIDDHVETWSGEMTYLHVWATVVKFKGKR